MSDARNLADALARIAEHDARRPTMNADEPGEHDYTGAGYQAYDEAVADWQETGEGIGLDLAGAFVLAVDTGNEAMQTPDDVARVLRAVADRIEGTRGWNGTIRDDNGNAVGSYAWPMTTD